VAIFIRFLQNNGNILFKVPFDASRRLAKENAFRFHRVPSEKHALFGLAKEQKLMLHLQSILKPK